jgi:hypothetical protein
MQQTNPLLRTLRLPGETVVLPSKALFYKNSEVANEVITSGGEIYVQPMTTYEEILMKTPDMLFTGQAIVQTFARCIPQIYNPLELLAADVDFLLIVLRKVSFGNQIAVNYNHGCSDSKYHEYAISLNQFIKQTTYADPASVLSMFEHMLPNGQTVNMQPFRFKDVLDISQIAVNEPTGDDVTDNDRAVYISGLLTAGTKPAIKSVVADGEEITDRAFIEEWVTSLPVLWVKELSQVIESANKWGANSKATVQCMDCGESVEIQVPLNPQSFFMLPSDLEIQT